MHYACQKQCHVCLGSHLTKPCLSCVVMSKTAAIHVRCQHSMCNFLSCKILQGPHPIALTRKAFLLAYWSTSQMIYHRGGEPERVLHCWFNAMAHKPWITAEFVTVMDNSRICHRLLFRTVVSKTSCSHFFGQ